MVAVCRQTAGAPWTMRRLAPSSNAGDQAACGPLRRVPARGQMARAARVIWPSRTPAGSTTLTGERGRSSAGRASGLQPEGQGFETPRLHRRTTPFRVHSAARGRQSPKTHQAARRISPCPDGSRRRGGRPETRRRGTGCPPQGNPSGIAQSNKKNRPADSTCPAEPVRNAGDRVISPTAPSAAHPSPVSHRLRGPAASTPAPIPPSARRRGHSRCTCSTAPAALRAAGTGSWPSSRP
jgi:hypothetical protein